MREGVAGGINPLAAQYSHGLPTCGIVNPITLNATKSDIDRVSAEIHIINGRNVIDLHHAPKGEKRR